MRILGWYVLSGVLLAAAPLAAQEHPKPVEKPKQEPKPKVDFSKFKFMEGCWAGELSKGDQVEENWTTPSENLLLSTTRYLTKGQATGYDFNRIQWVDTTVVFGITSGGRPEDRYYLKSLVDGYALFENPEKKSFPQRIMYRMASDGSLIPRNEGDGPSVELRFHRVKCPGSDKKIKE